MEDSCKLDPVSVFASLREQFPGECFLLESVEGPMKVARYSFIGVEPISVFRSKGGKIDVDGEIRNTNDPYGALRNQ
ncbi:MAG: hypothetical protein KJ653_00085, partial [Candidatus Thermoplasmatota archaeon]|nr:hypothetical protein [Candidatus Thermoplasmatota archaeon]